MRFDSVLLASLLAVSGLAAPIEERDAPADVTTVIRTDYKTDVVVKTQDIYDTVVRTDIVVDTRYHTDVLTDVRTDIVYQTHAANAPEVARPTPTAAVHSAEAPVRRPSVATHVQPVQPVQTHASVAHSAEAPATHVQAPATHVQAPAQTHAQAPAQTHAAAAPKATKASVDNDGDVDTSLTDSD